jgi:antitoxin component of MazEF toxin-antitoxin module
MKSSKRNNYDASSHSDYNLRIITKVRPGNKIEIEIPEGAVGKDVEVIVVLPQTPPTRRRHVLKLLEEIRSRHPHRSTAEIDRDLAAERNSWDS